MTKVSVSLPPGWFTGGLGGWQLLKSVFFVGERSYSLRENTFFASSTVEKKKKRKKITVISQVVRRRSSHLLTERASMKHSFYFPCRLYSSPSPPPPPPPPPDETLRVGVSSARRIKHPVIIRARRRRARISKCVSLYWCLSLSPRPRFSSPPLLSQIHLVPTGGGETGVKYPPSFFSPSPLTAGRKIRSPVLRSLPPHKLGLLTSRV